MKTLFQNHKLIGSVGNKALLYLTGKDFRLDLQRWSRLAPVTLPSKEADLRNSDKNDSACYHNTALLTNDLQWLNVHKRIKYLRKTNN